MARLSQIFAPKDRVFFDLFEEAAANALRAAELLDEMLRSFPEQQRPARGRSCSASRRATGSRTT